MNSTGFSQQKNQSIGGASNNFQNTQFRTSQMQLNQDQTLNNAQQAQLGQNPASLKGKLQNIEEMAKLVSDELSMHKKELAVLKSEKDSLENVLGLKSGDINKTLFNELNRLEEEMKRHYNFQHAENNRIQQMLNTLKQEKLALQQTLIGLQRRIGELEQQIGNADI
ncbi:hypothetical protein PPERSA_07442 [Pseudocohnilembus persalinus]|uniref:Uncharacterized protein n=1 Tax=Pseudocohnilembus persalinus TaxID=266149 RepID=A0A0V0QAN7_PSEPJ|nr:hypothetical protein PPERSA_07442 [Pseudocohnilembus persalinus]|eukprot:KRW99199.1 hypothetical protein PPERSA_07442 [Pseudocohnilembus persalinus]